MGVYIKDFEMPKNCAECQFSDVFAYPPDYDDEWICELTYLSMNWEDAQMRHSNCPLVELPTPHGRLIDADALSAHMIKVHKKWVENPELHNSVIQTIDDETMLLYAPTIIEAEGEQ